MLPGLLDPLRQEGVYVLIEIGSVVLGLAEADLSLKSGKL